MSAKGTSDDVIRITLMQERPGAASKVLAGKNKHCYRNVMNLP